MILIHHITLTDALYLHYMYGLRPDGEWAKHILATVGGDLFVTSEFFDNMRRNKHI